ncbi:hypothetical protein ACLOJK_020110 [Asimina triloba]
MGRVNGSVARQRQDGIVAARRRHWEERTDWRRGGCCYYWLLCCGEWMEAGKNRQIGEMGWQDNGEMAAARRRLDDSGEMVARWPLPLLCCGVWLVAEKSGRSVRSGWREGGETGSWEEGKIGFRVSCRRGRERE